MYPLTCIFCFLIQEEETLCGAKQVKRWPDAVSQHYAVGGTGRGQTDPQARIVGRCGTLAGRAWGN
ncbi:hypothetical protein BCL69_108010 [Nitrosomonas communis]|uniref:Uncharacterized protein n=1 Tax=Nitrosomonas communis TaxID=44574 RepID=A0A0F7KEQ5_9PROT|nr:hypothetical protein AAW31_09305 [Nitrosomonas communis]TYP77425.1 hypothetical protein BCL69_108010 [Nitrosomonas communis]